MHFNVTRHLGLGIHEVLYHQQSAPQSRAISVSAPTINPKEQLLTKQAKLSQARMELHMQPEQSDGWQLPASTVGCNDRHLSGLRLKHSLVQPLKTRVDLNGGTRGLVQVR